MTKSQSGGEGGRRCWAKEAAGAEAGELREPRVAGGRAQAGLLAVYSVVEELGREGTGEGHPMGHTGSVTWESRGLTRRSELEALSWVLTQRERPISLQSINIRC